jgi:hypothetical protein
MREDQTNRALSVLLSATARSGIQAAVQTPLSHRCLETARPVMMEHTPILPRWRVIPR